ncbi:hypothetical protein LR48_Vigan01g230900 [Vigna angularis]|uniref:Pentatricopeptide repeat-containing protein n=2 Tax=Phaseolus angularis TaxID=3914 RepID=A0A0L9TQ88_PHAAN|nr:pentatricopeptide repeat-containing protein At3g48250, chloroplastic [Vigna angularis]KAG2408201.1 Pentatricopeptide repeat-containing protein [Vigna angularis]KOM32753.1 hypothetical protein LR48_Vigan01g230900 [Vigna angularis]BAT76028.1 hypothetical protein VIGAN_01398100 [Vigna angularis var. angularis]
MNPLKAIVANLRFLDSPVTRRLIATRSIRLTQNQVTHFSLHTPSPFLDHSRDFPFPNLHRKIYFSSKSIPIAELILTSHWSKELEHELEKCYPSLTHETVVYVLKRLEASPEKAWRFFDWVSTKKWFRASSTVYGLILRILATEVTIKQFWITLWTMKRRGFYFYEEMYLSILVVFKRKKMDRDCTSLTHFYNRSIREDAMHSFVANVVGIISASKWGDDVNGELAKVKIQLSDNFVIRVLRELRSTPLKAYEFFRWVGRQSGYEHNTVTYNALARVLARIDSIEKFWSVIEEMNSVGHELDIDTYLKISRMLQRHRMMEDAVKLYELMMDSSYKPSVEDCSFLLKSISESDKPNLDLVFRVSKKYESTEHTLPKAIYDGIHRSLTNSGKLDEAENIVNRMRKAGHEPDNITYGQVIVGFCKMRRLEEACKVMEEMESCGCIPDTKTWTLLVQGHCVANEVDRALLCLHKMIEKGCNLDAAVLCVLTDSFLGQKRIDDAYKLLVEVATKHGASPSRSTYEKLIVNLLKIEKFEEALNLLCLTRIHKHTPIIEPFVQYISNFGSVEDAVKFLKSKGSPRSYLIYLRVFKSLVGKGRLSEAEDLLSKIPSYMSKTKEIRELFDSNVFRLRPTG